MNSFFNVKKCVGCGFCCIKAQCVASVRLYGNIGNCPSLIWNGSRYICDLMTKPGEIGSRYRIELSEGDGCCSDLNDWRNEVKPRRENDIPKNEIYQLDPIFIDFLNALGKEFISGDTIALTIWRMESAMKNKNVSDDKIVAVMTEILYHLKQNRPTFQDSFMGEISNL